MKQHETDVAFLHEYVAFSSAGSMVAAECLHAAFLRAQEVNDSMTMAHLQLRLHAEMVLSLETAGALLLAYSKWDSPGGILGRLLSYRPGDVPKFIEKVSKSSDALRLLCFPRKEDFRAHWGHPGLCLQAYSDRELKETVMRTCRMYLSESVRGAYNKIKHAGLCTRHPEIGRATMDRKREVKEVFVPLKKKGSRSDYDVAQFPVTGRAGRELADKYLKNIRGITDVSVTLAEFVGQCLALGILSPSQ